MPSPGIACVSAANHILVACAARLRVRLFPKVVRLLPIARARVVPLDFRQRRNGAADGDPALLDRRPALQRAGCSAGAVSTAPGGRDAALWSGRDHLRERRQCRRDPGNPQGPAVRGQAHSRRLALAQLRPPGGRFRGAPLRRGGRRRGSRRRPPGSTGAVAGTRATAWWSRFPAFRTLIAVLPAASVEPRTQDARRTLGDRRREAEDVGVHAVRYGIRVRQPARSLPELPVRDEERVGGQAGGAEPVEALGPAVADRGEELRSPAVPVESPAQGRRAARLAQEHQVGWRVARGVGRVGEVAHPHRVPARPAKLGGRRQPGAHGAGPG